MEFSLSQEQRRLQDLCTDLADDFERRAELHDREGSSPVENYRTLRDAGFYGMVVPRELGGWGSGFLDYVVAVEELAQGCASTVMSFNMHCVVARMLTTDPGLSEDRRRYVAGLITQNKKLICANLSEPGTTGLLYSTRAASTEADRVSGGWRVTGKRAFVTMVEASDFIAMFVHPTSEENPMVAIPLLVPTDAPGVRIERVWDTLGMRATRSDMVVLDDVFVSDENVFEELRIEHLPDWVAANEGPADLPYTAVYLGVGIAVLRAVVDNVRNRCPKGYSQPLAYHHDVRRRIARMSAELEGARWLVRYAAWRLDEGHQPTEMLGDTLRAKYAVGEAVAAAGRSALEIGGAHSLFKGSAIERLFRDTATAPIMQPNSDVCLGELGVCELNLDRNQIQPPLAPEPHKD